MQQSVSNDSPADGAPDDARPRRSPASAWAQLLRLPNLLTVPGDPIAGYLIASSLLGSGVDWRIIPAAIASLLLYAGGLAMNDWFDLAEDRRDRPTRPLPSGEIPQSQVFVAWLLLCIAGVGTAAIASLPAAGVAAVLAGLVLAYNAGMKRIAVLGPIVMGSCRAASFLLGLAVAQRSLPDLAVAAWPCLAIAGYVASLTAIAGREAICHRIGLRRYLPAFVIFAWTWVVCVTMLNLGLLWRNEWQSTLEIFLLLIVLVQAVKAARRLRGTPPPKVVQATVGSLVLALLPLQASIAVLASVGTGSLAGLVAGAALLLAWPIAAALAGKFYAS